MRTRAGKSSILIYGRAREIMTDFFIGLAVFLLVIGFAGVHTAPALPAPLAKTKAMIAMETGVENVSYDLTHLTLAQVPDQSFQSVGSKPGGDNKTMLIVMALLFSTLSAITIQFWRHLRREYASPRRKRGRSERHYYGG